MANQSILKRYVFSGLIVSTGIWGLSPGVVAQDSHGISPSGMPADSQYGNPVLPFTDVSPDHWAYQALLNLAGTYSCISGYPDRSFRGEVAVSRDEFAAGMDAYLGAVMGLIEQQQGEHQQQLEDLINSMEQSLQELRQLDQEVMDEF